MCFQILSYGYLGRVYDESMVKFPNTESSYTLFKKKKTQHNKKMYKGYKQTVEEGEEDGDEKWVLNLEKQIQVPSK